MEIRVDAKTSLFLLTQASTKIYGTKSDAAAHHHSGQVKCFNCASIRNVERTEFIVSTILEMESFLCLLPHPITAYQGSRYMQHQKIQIQDSTLWAHWPTLIWLDWFTSGRKSRGEIWQMDRLITRNSLYYGENLLWRDNIQLDQSISSIKHSLLPFHVCASLILAGPQLENVCDGLLQSTKRLEEQRNYIDRLLISVSPIEPLQSKRLDIPSRIGCIVKILAVEVSDVKQCLTRILGGISDPVDQVLKSWNL